MSKPRKVLIPMLVTCFLAGTVLAILAPFGTDTMSLMLRFLFWIGMCLVGGLGAGLTDLTAKIFKVELPNWQYALGQSFTASLAVATVMLILTTIIYGTPSWPQVLMVLFYVWVISTTISIIGMLIRKSRADTPANERAALYERLPPKLRSGKIYALAAEDHYVRVITSKGEVLLLMRLSDAVKETAPLQGLSPHRSWWVAEGGAQKIKKSEIVLHTDQTVPISRTGMKLVREAGWV